MKRVALLFLVCGMCAGATELPAAAERSWTVQYFGGAPSAPGKIERWDNVLSVSAERISLRLRTGQVIEIDPAHITALGYANKTMYREGTSAALAVASLPVGLIVYFAAKSRSHYIAIEFLSKEGTKTGVLLRAHKAQYGEIVDALNSVAMLVESKTTGERQQKGPLGRQE